MLGTTPGSWPCWLLVIGCWVSRYWILQLAATMGCQNKQTWKASLIWALPLMNVIKRLHEVEYSFTSKLPMSHFAPYSKSCPPRRFKFCIGKLNLGRHWKWFELSFREHACLLIIQDESVGWWRARPVVNCHIVWITFGKKGCKYISKVFICTPETQRISKLHAMMTNQYSILTYINLHLTSIQLFISIIQKTHNKKQHANSCHIGNFAFHVYSWLLHGILTLACASHMRKTYQSQHLLF